MGHIRLGRLPKRWQWPQLFESAELWAPDPAGIAAGITSAAADDLSSLRQRPDVIAFRIWLVGQLGDAALGDDFALRLQRFGVPSLAQNSPIAFVAAITRVRPPTRFPAEHSIFDAIATSSLRDALSHHFSMRTESLFDAQARTLKRHSAELAQPRVFASVTRRFLSSFTSRLIRYVADRELSSSLSTDGPLRDSGDVLQFEQRLNAYCYDMSRIVEDFAEGWFAKRRYQEGVAVTPDLADQFATLALRKLQMELESANSGS